MGIKMATGAGVDLAHRHSGGGNALGVVVGLLVPFYNRKAEFPGQVTEGPFQQSCFSRTGGTDQIEDENPLFLEQRTIEACKAVVFAKDILFDTDLRPSPRFLVMGVGMRMGGVMARIRVIMVVGMAMSVIMVMMVFMTVMMVVVVLMLVIWCGTAAGCAHGMAPETNFGQSISLFFEMQREL
jgi:hypothetical protein